jgi:hypothetical protein
MYRNSFERMCQGLFVYERNYFFKDSSLILKYNKVFPKSSYCLAFAIFYFAQAFVEILLKNKKMKQYQEVKSGIKSSIFCLIFGIIEN